MKQTIDWDVVTEACSTLAKAILKHGNIEFLVPIVRGGLIPAAIISNMTDIPIRHFAWFQRYSHGEAGDVIRQDFPEISLETIQYGCFIDDIIDSGQTYNALLQHYGNLDTYVAALCIKKDKHLPYPVPLNNLIVMPPLEFSPEFWVEFPWEQGALV